MNKYFTKEQASELKKLISQGRARDAFKYANLIVNDRDNDMINLSGMYTTNLKSFDPEYIKRQMEGSILARLMEYIDVNTIDSILADDRMLRMADAITLWTLAYYRECVFFRDKYPEMMELDKLAKQFNILYNDILNCIKRGWTTQEVQRIKVAHDHIANIYHPLRTKLRERLLTNINNILTQLSYNFDDDMALELGKLAYLYVPDSFPELSPEKIGDATPTDIYFKVRSILNY